MCRACYTYTKTTIKPCYFIGIADVYPVASLSLPCLPPLSSSLSLYLYLPLTQFTSRCFAFSALFPPSPSCSCFIQKNLCLFQIDRLLLNYENKRVNERKWEWNKCATTSHFNLKSNVNLLHLKYVYTVCVGVRLCTRLPFIRSISLIC